jgi:hypothetical protein
MGSSRHLPVIRIKRFIVKAKTLIPWHLLDGIEAGSTDLIEPETVFEYFMSSLHKTENCASIGTRI